MFTRVFEHLKNQEAKTACMFPNQAHYRIRLAEFLRKHYESFINLIHYIKVFLKSQ